MAFNRPTLTELRDRIGADIERHSDGDPNQRGSLEFAIKNSLTGAAHGLYGMLEHLGAQLFDDSSDDPNLLRRAAEYSIYRIAAKTALGNITATGNNGVVIRAGTEWSVGDERYSSDSDQTVSAGTATVTVTAVTAAASSNQVATTTLQIVSPIIGLDGDAVVDANGLTGGADIETIDRVRVRLQDRKKNPPMGGNPDDWIAWCKQGHQDVTRVWVYPNQDNLGATVYGITSCYVVTDNLVSPIPGAAILNAVIAYVDLPNVRPVGMKTFYILAPTQKLLNITFNTLTPNTVAVQQAIEAELKDLLSREAAPGGAIKLSHIREAISLASGEDDFDIDLITDFTCSSSEFAVLGVLAWPGA